ncbi:betaine/proline/choline family ABC transporter ATP-binding protein [Thermaerobacter subterraneus]|uniref:Quaternary amine transport ATP-binding protein n=1 Tax=Thermaerobacter subterraneus DSM 13965 TaxID=867903 RepID=K6PZP0_9FIRM|nr:betaine/proline/choline family ABC transporter ATP-binding protein [Thermaerobacter subterraneus]EKP94278.1 glycine betaine/L-proline transport ATP binding subunit [Thermaerobacter subterraneus DSM 13965]
MTASPTGGTGRAGGGPGGRGPAPSRPGGGSGNREPGSSRSDAGLGGRGPGPARPDATTGHRGRGRPGRDEAATPSPVLLAVQDLWKIFARRDKDIDVHDPEAVARAEARGAVVAVREASFRVRRGEIFVVMGLSGSGKSTLVRCLLRLVEPTAGRILFDGEDVTAMYARQLTAFRRTRVAMVFQHYGLLPHRTVLENVAFGLRLRGEPRPVQVERAREALARVGLEKWAGRYPAALSGGMRQRVGIARALARDADLLLMDEPFSGLDPLIRRELQDELLRLQEELHKTIVFITHDLQEALRLGDRLAIMRAGRIVQVGRPREIIQAPADDYVRRFVRDVREAAALAAGPLRAAVPDTLPAAAGEPRWAAGESFRAVAAEPAAGGLAEPLADTLLSPTLEAGKAGWGPGRRGSDLVP